MSKLFDSLSKAGAISKEDFDKAAVIQNAETTFAPSEVSQPSRVVEPVAEPPRLAEAMARDLPPAPLPVEDAPRGYSSIPLWMAHPDRYLHIRDNFRVLKNSLARIKATSGHKMFMFTGPSEGMGVSTVVFNLGMVLAWELPDVRTVLVDADLENPTSLEPFGHTDGPGLTDYLAHGLPLSRVLCASFLPNFHLISLGQSASQIQSPFDSPRINEFLLELRLHYDFVVIDSAPALRSTHSRIMSAKVDAVVMVAAANQARWQVVNELKQELTRNDANVCGSVLSKRKFVIPRFLYRSI